MAVLSIWRTDKKSQNVVKIRVVDLERHVVNPRLNPVGIPCFDVSYINMQLKNVHSGKRVDLSTKLLVDINR